MGEAPMNVTVKTNKAAESRHPILHQRPLAVEQLRTAVDRLLSDFLRGYWHVPFRRSVVDVEPYWRGEIRFGPAPAVDIVEKDDGYKLTAELPGLEPRDVTTRFSDGTLTIEGEKNEPQEDATLDHFLSERGYGTFRRSFRVSDGVDPDKVEASFKNGVLTVTLPKTAEARKKHKKIAIRAA
jgi:HSP20 family protein